MDWACLVHALFISRNYLFGISGKPDGTSDQVRFLVNGIVGNMANNTGIILLYEGFIHMMPG